MPQYSLANFDPNTHFFEVSAVFDATNRTALNLGIARWRPARYDLQFYVQFIQNIRFFDAADLDDSKELFFTKTSLDTWEIDVTDLSQIRVVYSCYANQFEAGGTFIGDQMMLLNPINFLIFESNGLDFECGLSLDLDAQIWTLAGNNHTFTNTEMRQSESHIQNTQRDQKIPNLKFASFHDLADTPLFLAKKVCNEFKIIDFEVADLLGGKIATQIVLYGLHKLNLQKLEADFTAFMTEQVKVFKGFASDKYTFLCILPAKSAYHGVEHSQSSVNIFGPGFELTNQANPLIEPTKNQISQKNYTEFLGLCCHEFFHHWNIKSIRPIELNIYNYSRENLFKTGYVAEGFTTFYGDLMLLRAGLIGLDEFAKIIGKNATAHLQNFGKNAASMHDSSLDLWIDGYKKGIPDDKVNIYVEGCLQAAILDSKLREKSSNQICLDDLMYQMYLKFGHQKLGYTENDLIQICNQLTGHDFNSHFQTHFAQKIDLIDSLSKSLLHLGLKLTIRPSFVTHEAYFGFKVGIVSNKLEITKILPSSQNYHRLSLGDQLLGLNGQLLTAQNYLGWFEFYLDQRLELSLIRAEKIVSIELVTDAKNGYKQVEITKLDNSLP